MKNNLAVFIDVHYYPYINMNEPDNYISYEENFNRLNILWNQIAEHYKDYPQEVYFDLLNEPNLVMGFDKWNSTISDLIKTVPVTNPDRILIVAIPNYQILVLNLVTSS